VSNDSEFEDGAGQSLGGAPDPDDVEHRAEGRPPEERTSGDPAAQAQAILQESEDRIAQGADKAGT
jgi:hypothetical protein